MKLAGARWVNVAVTLVIILSSLLILYILFIGGVNIRFGEFVPSVGKAKLTCNAVRNPCIILVILLLLKPIVARPAPLRRAAVCLKTNRRAVLLGALVTAAAAFPRFWDLGLHSLNPDALLWIERGQKTIYALREHEYMRATAHLGHPGVVPAALIGASYIYLGEGTSTLSYGILDPVTAARFPIAAIGTLACLLLYLLGRRSFGDAAAFWGAVFLALYPPHIAMSRVVHIDSTLVLFFMLTVLSYLISEERASLRWKIASAVFFGLALLTKSPAILLPFVLFGWKALVRLRDRRGETRLLEAGDLGWLGLGLGIYLTLFTKLWFDPRRLNWTDYASSVRGADRLVGALNAAAALPWLKILIVIVIIGLAWAGARRARTAFRGRMPRVAAAVLLILACLSFIQVFRQPLVNTVYLATKIRHVEEVGHTKYWMGRLVTKPPRWFYPFMLGIQSPPAVLGLMAWGGVTACAAYARRGGRWRALLLCLVAPIGFIAAMAVGNKMAVRYIAPAFPFLCLLAGAGLVAAADAAAHLFTPTRRAHARIAAQAAVGFIVAASCIVPLVRVFPYPDIYCNILAGGPAGASRMVSFGVGVGSKEAAAYLKGLAKSDDSIFATTIHGEFRYHWLHDTPRVSTRVLVNRTKPPHVDWVVFPLADTFKRQDESLRALDGKCPRVWAMTLCSVNFVEIYRVEDPPQTTGRVYEAEGLESDTGSQVVDNNAGESVAVRGLGRGAVLYGPWERYAPGAWRAVFRVKERGAGNAATRLSVTGISKQEVFGSGEAPAGDSPPSDDYRDVPVDFTLAAPRRIQFCVDSLGPGERWVDRVTVERR
ncbi:MAG: glycosyltransferase family 39 protein [Chlamydiota bacterium]